MVKRHRLKGYLVWTQTQRSDFRGRKKKEGGSLEVHCKCKMIGLGSCSASRGWISLMEILVSLNHPQTSYLSHKGHDLRMHKQTPITGV